jgi:hypothetical protein
MNKSTKGKGIVTHGIKPVSEGLKPTSGTKTPKAPKGGTSQSNKGNK